MRYEFIGKALLINDRILAIADIHLGYEENLTEKGVLLPRGEHLKETIKDLGEIFSGLKKRGIKLDKIVIVGDLKHQFGKISGQEWSETLELISFLEKNCKKVILVKGNHDNILGPIAYKKKLKIEDFYVEEEVAFLHGHKEYKEIEDKKIKLVVCGHFHPAIMISDKYKKETYKCFLEGGWIGKKVVILPSFIHFVMGKEMLFMDLVRGFSSEFSLKLKLENFNVQIIGDKVYDFGKLKDLRRLI
ncbi:MAG: metallophosphoesterase [archaeon]